MDKTATKLLVENYKPWMGFVRDEFTAIVTGARGGLPKDWREVQRVLAGGEIRTEAWMRATRYVEYSEEDAPVKWWWELLEEYKPEQRTELLQWCTGWAALPADAAGFRFTIERDPRGAGYLPKVQTCTQRVYLP